MTDDDDLAHHKIERRQGQRRRLLKPFSEPPRTDKDRRQNAAAGNSGQGITASHSKECPADGHCQSAAPDYSKVPMGPVDATYPAVAASKLPLSAEDILTDNCTDYLLKHQALAAIENETIERCIKAVDDAGGDNCEYHQDAIRALKEK